MGHIPQGLKMYLLHIKTKISYLICTERKQKRDNTYDSITERKSMYDVIRGGISKHKEENSQK